MTRRDRVVTALLVLVLVAAGVAIVLPRTAGPAASSPSAEPPGGSFQPATVYREGVVGVPESITPVTARTRSERTLVGLIFSGLVKLGPGDTLEPDLASGWTVNDAGTSWTVVIRPDARWQDGAEVTADDVVYTVNALKDPAASGGLAASWAEVTATAVDPKTVRFDLASPIGGFLAALTQPLLPSHLLADVPMASLATSEFATSPVGSGPYALAQLDGTHAVLVPVASTTGSTASPSPSASASASASTSPSAVSPGPTGSAAASAGSSASSAPASGSAAPASGSAAPASSAAASEAPSAAASEAPSASTPSPIPTVDPSGRPIDRIEVTFYDTEAALSAAFTAGDIDGAAGLSASTAATLGAEGGVAVLHYPTTTLSAVILNLRPSHPELRVPGVRTALLAAIDRAAIANDTLGGAAVVADSLVPPASSAYDAAAAGTVPYDPAAAAAALTKAGWKKIGGHWAAPGARKAYQLELVTVPADASRRLAAEASAIAGAWTALGFNTSVTELAATDLATRLRSGEFTSALLDVSLELEPDLYPLLASTQVRSNGSNLSGYQDPALDSLLEAARAPGTDTQRAAAIKALLAGLAARRPILPIVWVDELVVARGLSGNVPRLIVHPGDRFWDVLAWRLAASR